MLTVVSIILIIHICAGTIGLLSGTVSLFSRKGFPLHRKWGHIFFVSMLVMGATGAFVAFMRDRPDSTIAGLLTFYLVSTAWMAVRRKSGEIGNFEKISPLLALSCAIYAISVGVAAAETEIGTIRGFPPTFYFGQAGLAAFMIALDVSVIVRGGLSGAQRIARHLWRMGFAMFVAATSIFLGNPQVFPEPVRRIEILAAPVLIIVVTSVFWLLRVQFTNLYKKPKKSLPHAT
ncbi:DUF2306 domain-containing protein [Parasphingorhabdus sp.]|uniref:DUF2306 domain-containing protein n=1 Tax=Parasphingorhabdus sp. TaxID=2709688 RepID=UPI002B26E843|nr:DUF2306 domain-containing protein [Parasphingorhabdus sp.]